MLPPQLAKWNNLRYLTRRRPGEWSAECPKCGDSGHIGGYEGVSAPDRFRIFDATVAKIGKPCGWCRSCGHFELADYNDYTYSSEEWDRMTAERTRLANLERERVRQKIETLEQQAEWRAYHDAMSDEHRKLWREAGIDDPYQDWWELGFKTELAYSSGGTFGTSPALTIPYWREGGVVNVQFRLLDKIADKYRFTPGLPAPAYLPEKDSLPNGTTLVVEGAKKAMVSYLHLGDEYNIVGIPSKYLSLSQAEVLKDCDPVIFALDPDANDDGTSARNAKLLDGRDVRIATLPDKIDDLFVVYGADRKQVSSYLSLARPVS